MQMDVNRLLDTLRARHLVPDTCQAALLMGSAARGWSNKRSDLDFCLISTEPWSPPDSVEVLVPLQPSGVLWHVFHADNHDWDLAYWVDGQVDQMLAKVARDAYDPVRAASDDVLTPREEGFLARLATCVPLVGDAWVERRRDELRASAFRTVLVTRSLGSASLAIEDALGQLENGDMHSAVLSARIALGHTVDALLEDVGEFGSQIPKWRARRFQEANPAALDFAQYWGLETMRTFDADEPSKWVHEVLALCQALSSKIAG